MSYLPREKMGIKANVYSGVPWSFPWLAAFTMSFLFFHCVPKLFILMSECSLHMSWPLAVFSPFCVFIQGGPYLGSTLLPMTSCCMNVGSGPPVTVCFTRRPRAPETLSSGVGKWSPWLRRLSSLHVPL